MEENRASLTWKYLGFEIFVLLLSCAAVFGLSFWQNGANMVVAVRDACMALIGTAVTGFVLRREFLTDQLDCDNAEHLFRFWTSYIAGILFVLCSVFLPVAGWPYPVVFVMLALFSDRIVGIVAASSLLMLSTLVTGSAGSIFLLYFVSGVFAVILFGKPEQEWKIAAPLLLSLLCLLLLETANVILTANEKIGMESFVIPLVNLIVTGLLMMTLLKIYSGRVLYRYHMKYQELNDTENPVLVQMRKTSRGEYFRCIHTTYFCERIAGKLNMDVEALKCAGYYHRIGDLNEVCETLDFPPRAKEILQEYATYKTKPVKRRETAVLILSDMVISTMLYLIAKTPDKQPDCDQVIGAVFEQIQKNGTFDHSDLTLNELRIIQKTFREEKLYYDFLR